VLATSIPSQNDGRIRRDRGCKNVAIFGVRQREPAFVAFPVSDVSVGQHRLHELAGRRQPRVRDGARCRQVADPFVVDRIRPSCGDEVVNGELDQEVSQMKGIQDAGIIDDDRRIRGHG
jgi:hypothetical protein